jgi:hypothetical protein
MINGITDMSMLHSGFCRGLGRFFALGLIFLGTHRFPILFLPLVIGECPRNPQMRLLPP